jgi:tetratricopeptide (TPR) repeat protein
MDELKRRQFQLLSVNAIGLKQAVQAVGLAISFALTPWVMASDADQQLDSTTEMVESGLAEGVAAAAREAAREVENLLQEVEVLRGQISDQVAQDGNTWHAGIAESQLALGVAFQSLDDHPAALSELERAVHINRVNHGLFALEQVPALLLQVKSNLAMDDWQAADERMQYAFYVYTQALADNEAEMVPALIDYAHWQLTAYAEKRGNIPSVRLVDAYQLLRVANSILDRHPTPEAYPRASFKRQMAYVAWLIYHSDLNMWLDSDKLDARVVNDDWVLKMTGEDYVTNRSPYLMGESALEEVVTLRQAQFEAALPDTPESRQALMLYVEAMKQQADWNLVFDRRYEAMDLYEKAWQLTANVDEVVADQSFQYVHMLPMFRLEDIVKGHNETGLTVPGYTRIFLNNDMLSIVSDGQAERQVTLEFGISRFGRPTHVEVMDVKPEDDHSLRRQIVSMVQSRKFRPWLAAGEAEDSPKLTKSFSFGIETEPEATQ